MPIENLRSMLVIGLCLVLFLMWQQWQRDYGPKSQPIPTTSSEAGPSTAVTAAPVDVPAIPDQPPSTQPSAESPIEGSPAELVRVRTDLLDLQMDDRSIYRLSLLNYPVSVEGPEPFPLLNDSLPNIFVVESGLLGSNGEPNAESVFVPRERDYVLEEGSDELNVEFTWSGTSGIELTKTYVFKRGSYVVDVSYRVYNRSGEPWSGRFYGQFRRTQVVDEGGLFRIYTYTGGVLSNPEKPYEKVDFEDMLELPVNRDVTGGWAAMIQHYFAAAWVPSPELPAHYYTKALENAQYILGLYYDQAVSPGASDELKLTAYIGPKIQDRLEEVAPGLRRTVDFGWLFFISEGLFWALEKINGWVQNWGWSIIILTILIKLLFFQLSAASYKSMAKMRKLQPRMVQLKERYGTDKQRMNQAMMELYKKEKINPLGGCLPILVQIPVFIALYWVLLESVELRQASFVFWLQDLSQYDPYFVLPILMGLSMLVQQRLNPTPPDPIQAKVMMALPFVFTFFFLFFPSGLVLYWFVNNLLSIMQQWVITRRIEAGGD